MSAKTFKLIHYFDSGFYDNRKIYEFDSSENSKNFTNNFISNIESLQID